MDPYVCRVACTGVSSGHPPIDHLWMMCSEDQAKDVKNQAKGKASEAKGKAEDVKNEAKSS